MSPHPTSPFNLEADRLRQPVTVIPISSIPNCVPSATLTLYPHQQRIATQFKSDLLAKGGYVEKQAVCTSPLYTGMTLLSYAVTDYSAIHTLRAQGLPIAAIGSGSMLCCPARNEIYLQRRSANSATYPHKLACFGGHFTPDRKALGYGMLLDTLIEELREEAGCDLLQLGMSLPADLPPMYMIIETSTGGVQFSPLAFALTPEQADLLHGSYEGELETFHLIDDLEYLLKPSHWSLMGYTCFATWHSLGFPLQKNWQYSAIQPSVHADIPVLS